MANELKVQADPGNVAVSTLPSTLKDSYQKRLGSLIDLNDSQKKRLKGWLKKRIQEWEEDTSDLHKMLEEDNELVEGIVAEPSDMYEGWGSNVHVDVTGIYMEVFLSIEKRSILGADTIWYAESDNDQLWDLIGDIDTMLNQKARNEWNISQMIPLAIWAKNRDGLCAVKVTWEEDYEKTNDIILLTSADDFLNEFPSPEDAGITDEQWNELQDYVSANATDETPVEIPITFEKRKYYGNKAHVVERIDFVTFPATIQTIYDSSCRGYGMRFRERKEEVRQKMKDKVYYEDEARKLIEKGGTDEITSYQRSKDYVQGLKRTNKKDEYEEFELVVKGQLDGEDGEDGKYLVTYNKKKDLLLRCTDFPYRVDFYAIFEVNKRPNQLGGVSLPRKTREMNDEIDTQHNQRINARTISSVPTFKGHIDLKKELDFKSPELRWRPGGIIWSSKPELFDQFRIQPTDLGESMSEEKNDFAILDLSVGAPASLFSGQTSIGDPNAPGNKTAMMIQQGNMRMDDPLMEDREGVDMLGQICLSHLYQFGPPMLQFIEQQQDGGQNQRVTKTIHKKFLRTGINMHMKGITIIQNPDAEMAKKMNLHQILMSTMPTYAQNPKLQLELVRDALKAGREVGRDRYLPTMEEMERQLVEIQKKAMMEIELQKQQSAIQAEQQAQEQKRQTIDKNIQDANRVIKAKTTAEKLVEQGISNPVANGVS